MLDEKGRYLNFSGCGNTFSSDHPVVRNYLLECLRNWVVEGGVDGFRFDLASVLGRDRRGNVLLEPPVISRISEDSLLQDSKLIAEPWDAAGLYQVGTFPGAGRWSDWNGRYRDDVRKFWRGDPDMTSALATRLCGSDDLYHGRGPLHSINFICCHDGFTLYDLVSYNHKHNEANGEGNRDGNDANWSWNCGVEGPTHDPAVIAIRNRQVRNLLATLMVSQGVPMILGGDELLRTQNGNNNAWCQDNAVSWLDWTLLERNAGFARFLKMMIAFRKAHRVLERRTFFTGGGGGLPPEILWHGVSARQTRLFPRQPLAGLHLGRKTRRSPERRRSRYLRGDECPGARRSTSGSPPPPPAAHGADSSTPPVPPPTTSSRRFAGRACRSMNPIASRPTQPSSSSPSNTLGRLLKHSERPADVADTGQPRGFCVHSPTDRHDGRGDALAAMRA